MHDSHIHLNLEPLKSNLSSIIESFTEEGGKHILTQGTDFVDIQENFEIVRDFPEIIQVAVALHPTFFEENTIYKGRFKNLQETAIKFLKHLEDVFEKNIDSISAIGECGLDYYQISFDKSLDIKIVEEVKEIQKIFFRKHIELAIKYQLPLSIHARGEQNNDECVKDTLEILADTGKGIPKGSFHSYTGEMSFVQNILDLGFHIGFNAIITYNSGENVREILKKTPLERILFETDGPFLPPQSVRKNKKIKEKFAEPVHIREIMRKTCEVKNVDMRTLETITDESYKTLFVKQF